MKILMINVCCGKGSTGRICTDLASELERLGHTVKIAFGRDGVDEKHLKYAVQIGTDFDVKMHALKARLFDAAGFGSIRATKEFIEWVKQFDPDVIHLHNIHGYYLNIEILFDYLRNCGKRIIWTLHDCWPFTGHAAYCDAVNCERWVTGCYNCPNIKEYPTSLLDRSKFNWKKKKLMFEGIPNLTIVTPSEWLARLVKKSFLAQYQVEVIHNGIDLCYFFPLENDTRKHFGISNKYMIVGKTISDDIIDGFYDYFQIADILGSEYQIVLVDLNKEQISKLPKNIIGIESTNSIKELAMIYSAADLLLNLSSCENEHCINQDFLACGTHLITYSTSESTNRFGNGIIQIKSGDIQNVVKSIESFRNQDKLRTQKSKKSEIDNDSFLFAFRNEKNFGFWEYKESLGMLGKKVLLGVASVWDKRKGLDDIVKLSEIIMDQIVIIGVSENQKKSLPKKITAYSRTNNVDELRKLYSIADCFINPTYEDNFPTTNIEALACGTPVVSYRTGGSPESATFVIEKGDVKDLNLKKIILPEACTKRSVAFSKERMITDYSSLI